MAALKRKLEELKNLATNLPDSTAVLNDAAPQLDAARKLLQDAQDARWAFTLTDFCYCCLKQLSAVHSHRIESGLTRIDVKRMIYYEEMFLLNKL